MTFVLRPLEQWRGEKENELKKWSQNLRDIIHYTANNCWHTFFKLMNFINFHSSSTERSNRIPLNYIQISSMKRLISSTTTWIRRSKTKKKPQKRIFRIIMGIFSVAFHHCLADTKSGLASKLLCRQRMSFEICLQSRNSCHSWLEAVHIQHTMLLSEEALERAMMFLIFLETTLNDVLSYRIVELLKATRKKRETRNDEWNLSV